jgi:hypothetical protein
MGGAFYYPGGANGRGAQMGEGCGWRGGAGDVKWGTGVVNEKTHRMRVG